MNERFDPAKLRRVILKVGSNSIVSKNGEVRLGFLGELVTIISRLMKAGTGVVLVSSGAIAMGFTRIGLSKKPTDIPSRQACAALGQTELMSLYQRLFDAQGTRSAQVLLVRDDLEDRRRYLNAREALLKLIDLKVVPVVNENDSVGIEEIVYGDNDLLSALVAGAVDADLLVLLTDVEGLYDSPPGVHHGAKLIHRVTGDIGVHLLSASGSSSGLGSGGMRSKLEAAALCSGLGIPTVISKADGTALGEVLSGGERGTFIPAVPRKVDSRRRWLSKAAQVQGTLTLDDGAVVAITQKQKSLLPTGITSVEGDFPRGAPISLCTTDGLEIGRGFSRYPADDLRRVIGKHGKAINRELGYTFGDEAVHKDDMVLITGLGRD